MGNKNREKWWIRLKKFVQRKKVSIGTGDGGVMSDRVITVIGDVPKDSTFVIKDTAVVAHPKKQ